MLPKEAQGGQDKTLGATMFEASDCQSRFSETAIRLKERKNEMIGL